MDEKLKRFTDLLYTVHLDKAIKKLENKKDPHCTLRVGKTYKLNQDLICGRILAKSGAVVEVNGTTPKSWGGSYLTIKPISGKFALSVHSSFFSSCKVSINGGSSKFYTASELKEIIGIIDFTNEITFDDYGNAGRILADEK